MKTDLRKKTKEIYAAFNAHDLDKFLSYHTDDYYGESVATGAVSRNKEELKASFVPMMAAIPDLKIELTSCFACGNKQCEEVIVKGTHTGELFCIPATGKTFSVRSVLIREFRGSKVSRVTTYSDNATLMRQLGVLPSPPKK